MTKHTPGPWGRTTDARRIISTGWHVTAPDGSTIAVVLGERSEELNANVRLIAAAPELLAVLQQLLVWDDGNLPGDLIDIANATVKKAASV